MFKVFKYGLLGIVGLIIAVIIAIPFFISADQIKQVVESEASKATGMPVTIETLDISVTPPSLAITNLKLTDVEGGTPKMVVESGEIAVELDPLFDGRVETSGITFRNISLRVSEAARGKEVHVVHIDEVTGAVLLNKEALTMPGWKVKLYTGQVDMEAKLTPLEGKERTLTADVVTTGIQMLPLLKDAAGQDKVSGTFNSKLKLSTSGEDEKKMQRSLKVDGPVELTNGQFEGVGLSGVAAALVHGNVTGASGAILFDTFNTQLKVRGQDIYLQNINLLSSAFNAEGFVDIKGTGALKGEIKTSGMKGLSGATLLVGGTTESPKIYPAPSSAIGGVIGATVGGPAGAAVGSKVGGVVGDAVEGVGKGIKSLFGD